MAQKYLKTTVGHRIMKDNYKNDIISTKMFVKEGLKIFLLAATKNEV